MDSWVGLFCAELAPLGCEVRRPFGEEIRDIFVAVISLLLFQGFQVVLVHMFVHCRVLRA